MIKDCTQVEPAQTLSTANLSTEDSSNEETAVRSALCQNAPDKPLWQFSVFSVSSVVKLFLELPAEAHRRAKAVYSPRLIFLYCFNALNKPLWQFSVFSVSSVVKLFKTARRGTPSRQSGNSPNGSALAGLQQPLLSRFFLKRQFWSREAPASFRRIITRCHIRG